STATLRPQGASGCLTNASHSSPMPGAHAHNSRVRAPGGLGLLDECFADVGRARRGCGRGLARRVEGASMSSRTRSTTVACPPERVFAILAEVERLPEFSGMTVAVRNGPGRPIQAGDIFDQVVTVLGKELESEWRAVE